MLKGIAAIFLASLLAVMAYGIFWLVSLNYTTDQMSKAVDDALGARITFGAPQWVPDPAHVTMDLPSVKLSFSGGPVREIRAPELTLVSSFLMRDRWTMELPKRVEVVLANGKVLLLESEKATVQWMESSGGLTLRAEKIRILDLAGTELVNLSDVLLDRKSSDRGVRVNLASRPQTAEGEWVLTGQLVMPPASMAAVVNLFGAERMPSVGDMVRGMVGAMRGGDLLQLDNISFKSPHGLNGAVFGNITLLADGRATGTVALASDNPSRLLGWVDQAALVQPRTPVERSGAIRFRNELFKSRPTVRMENMQSTLMMNGYAAGPLPVLADVVSRLWPQ